MKIFFINTNKSWGGGEKWHFEAAMGMSKRGHSVSILALQHGELFKKSQEAGIATLAIQISNLSFLNPFRIITIAYLFRKNKPDAVILNFSSDVKTAGLAARIAGIKNIIYRRGNAKPIKNTVFNRFLYKNVVTRIIANSQETKRSILVNNSRWLHADKIQVIYNGIDLQAFENLSSEKIYSKKGDEIIIGAAGRLSPEKGHKYLLEMAKIIESFHLKYTILIAGEGPLMQELKNHTSDTKIEDKIVFLGFVTNIKSFMQSIDIFVLPSLWEGFGYVTIEAMACGKPVIAFNTGCNPEIIINNKTGFLVDKYDIKALSGRIKELIIDPDLRKSMGNEGRLRVQEVFNRFVAEKKLEDFLTNL